MIDFFIVNYPFKLPKMSVKTFIIFTKVLYLNIIFNVLFFKES